jgi:hypothetical protein
MLHLSTSIPEFLMRLWKRKGTLPVNQYEGFATTVAAVLRDRCGTRKAGIPEVDLKSEALGDDPLAIYKPTGAKHVDAGKAMGVPHRQAA